MKKTAILTAILAAGSLFAETVIQDSAFNYSSGAAKVTDSAAVDKSAGRMDASKGWTLSYNINKDLFGPKVMTISLRTDHKDEKGAFTVGIYNRKSKKIVLSKRLTVGDFAKDSYSDVTFSKWDFKEGDYFFVGSIFPKNKTPGYIYVDKITFK